MKRAAFASILVASLATTARADDPDAALRAKLAQGVDQFVDATLPRLWPRDQAMFAGSPGGVLLTRAGDDSDELPVLEHRDNAYRVAMPAMGARVALWIDAAEVVPSVNREVGVASSATAKVPGADDDGLFLEPGVKVAGKRRGDRVHVVYTWDEVTVDGWIAADAIGETHAPMPALGDGWASAPAQTKIVVGGRAIATSHGVEMMRSLPHGRGELSGGHWHARGKLILPKAVTADANGEDGGLDGGMMGGTGAGPAVPAGACLYDRWGNLVGAVDVPELLFGVVATKAGFDVNVSLVGMNGAMTLHVHKVGGAVERCVR
jgi:hypothetical protein